MDLLNALGLEWLNDSDTEAKLNEYISEYTDYVIPGYKYNYRYCCFPGIIEFMRCEKLNGDIISTDIQVNEYVYRTFEVCDTDDASSAAPFYMLKNSSGIIPVKVVCPDVLPSIEKGDILVGRLAAFCDCITQQRRGIERCDILPDTDNTVCICGMICSDSSCTQKIEFDGKTFEYTKLDISTNDGVVLVVVRSDKIDFIIKYGVYVSVHGVISFDVSEEFHDKNSTVFTKYAYKELLADADTVRYKSGFIADYRNNQKVIIKSLCSGDFTRFTRCCTPKISFACHKNGVACVKNRDGIVDEFRRYLPEKADGVSVEHILSCVNESCIGHEALAVMSGGTIHTVIWFDVSSIGAVNRIEFFDANQCELGTDTELHLYAMLNQALCNSKSCVLREHLSDNCTYRSDYADIYVIGADRIVARIKSIEEKCSDKKRCTYKFVYTNDELRDTGSLPPIYSGKRCTMNYQDGKLAYILFMTTDEQNKINNILLSCDKNYLKRFDSADEADELPKNVRAVDDIITAVYGNADTVSSMRENDIPGNDVNDVYVWKKADEFAINWLGNNDYKVSDTVILEDCIGYQCKRREVEYAVFLFAYGAERAAPLDGDYCAKLRDTEIGHGKNVIVIYIHVDKKIGDNGETEYTISGYSGEDSIIEPWLCTTFMGRNILSCYPGKEIADLCPRIIAAYNSENTDIIRALCTNDAFLKSFKDKYNLKGMFFFNFFKATRRHYGVMKRAYIRFNDIVYYEALYIENYAFLSFEVNSNNRIECVVFHSLDNKIRDMIISDELIMHCEEDDVPRLASVSFYEPSQFSRFSLHLTFENGEIKRYDLEGDFGNDEVTSFQGKAMTDRMFANGRLTDCIPDVSYIIIDRNYSCRGQGVEFINGTAVSTIELYHNSYPVRNSVS